MIRDRASTNRPVARVSGVLALREHLWVTNRPPNLPSRCAARIARPRVRDHDHGGHRAPRLRPVPLALVAGECLVYLDQRLYRAERSRFHLANHRGDEWSVAADYRSGHRHLGPAEAGSSVDALRDDPVKTDFLEGRALNWADSLMSIRPVAFGDRCCILDYHGSCPRALACPVACNEGRPPRDADQDHQRYELR